ncbi:MAG: hypothetical protein Q4F65_13850 [Propionibacteriaceae bacterium]|nr:hypothetical protein [Propionibacteriaceae bacterium]
MNTTAYALAAASDLTMSTAPRCSFCYRPATRLARARVGSHANNVAHSLLCDTHNYRGSGTRTRLDNVRTLTVLDALGIAENPTEYAELHAAGRLLFLFAEAIDDDPHTAAYVRGRAFTAHRHARAARV